VKPSVTDDILLMLTHGRGSPADAMEFLIPRLEVFVFIGDLSFDEELLGDMVESRWHISYELWNKETSRVSRLREVSLCLMDEMKPEVVERLQQYKDEGLKLSIS